MSTFRPDIQGLRALAIGAVLLDHAGVPQAAGGFVGVDVFFVISGFLITRMLADELERRGRVELAVFYARRVKRLLPSAVVVVAATVIVAALVVSPVRADAIARDVMAASVYAMNLRLAAQSVDYFAAGAEHSPLQHFWSLAVEEQFYLAWPLLLFVFWRVGRRFGAPHAAQWLALITAVFASFSYALQLTADTPAAAYFSTPARVWELAAGGIAALALGDRRVGERVAAPLAWAGVAAIAVAVWRFDGMTAVPGAAALVPVLGTVALLVAGTARAPSRPVRALARGPMQWVGARSYTWYLWHWPVLVFAAELGRARLSVGEGLLLTAASLLAAHLTHSYVEEPLRRSPLHRRLPRRTVAAAPAAALATLALGLGLTLVLPSPHTLAQADVDGAARLEHTRSVQASVTRGIRPAPRDAAEDRGRVYDDGCLVPLKGTRSGRCVYGAPSARRTAVLFGDSHAMQWFPALDRIARERGWRLVVLTKSGCQPAEVTVFDAQLRRPYHECDTWRERALRRIERVEHPFLVVITGAAHLNVTGRGGERIRGAAARAAIADGYVPTLRRLRRTGAAVRVIRETPRPPGDIPACVAAHLKHLRRCAFPAAAALHDPSPEEPAARRVAGVEKIDLSGRFCQRGLCPAVIGDVLVYRNAGHITATYARTLTPWIARRLPRG